LGLGAIVTYPQHVLLCEGAVGIAAEWLTTSILMRLSSFWIVPRRLQEEIAIVIENEEGGIVNATAIGTVIVIAKEKSAVNVHGAGVRTVRPSVCRRSANVRSSAVMKRKRSAKGRLRMPRVVTEL
jgi:hypothetical protein